MHIRSLPAARAGLLALLLLCTCTALPAAAAPGVNLAWNHCLGEGTGVQNLLFACDTNEGTSVMTGSFVPPANIANVVGVEIVIDLASATPTLPAWWEFRNSGTCRQASLTTDPVADPADLACPDWAAGHSAGGLANYCTLSGPCVDHPTTANAARVKLVYAVAAVDKQNLTVGQEYFAFHLTIDHQKTVGTGSCAGCQVPVCIVLNSINVVPEGNIGNRFLSTPTTPGSNAIGWQGGGVPVTGHGTGCPAATAMKRSAWGELKQMYR